MAVLRALLLIDVVDSTRLTAQLGDEAAAALWSTHDRLARALIERWHGREIDKTDGILVLFETVAEAVSYAIDYHAEVCALGIVARAGVHFGAVTLRHNAAQDIARGAKPIEVDGIALPVVARIMPVALGAQTLLSEDAFRALGHTALRTQSHGHWAMHGVADPVELFEVIAGDAEFRAPEDGAKAFRVLRQGDTWQPLRGVRHTLPAERDRFVGRRAVIEALSARFDAGSRLVTALGIGGVGKTRLVTRFAWLRRAHYAGGVWFCDLSQARGIDGLLFAAAQGLDVPLGPSDAAGLVGQAIAGRGRCLVILDNFEQVARLAEETLGRWLERAPEARFLVTSREVLGIVGEDILAVPPLDQIEAVELFVRRSEATQIGRRAEADDIAAIDALVKMLDGLPLAIELAAARARVLPPRQLLSRMSDRFAVLLTRSGRHDRQATLRAAFDWSWELLSDAERSALAKLSVFRGGFSLDSVSAIVGDRADDGAAMLDMLQVLVDKSLVRPVSDTRFDLLESVREYVAGHLRTEGHFVGSGAACEADTLSRHWRYFASVDERVVMADRCAELDNIATACRRAAEAHDGVSAVGCLCAAWAALRLTGPYEVAVELARVVDGMAALGAGDRARVHAVAADALDTLGQVERARPHLEQGMVLARAAGDAVATARLLIVRGGRLGLEGESEAAVASLTEAHALALAAGDGTTQRMALIVLGRVMEYQSRFAEARDHYERALVLARAAQDPRSEAGILANLGGIHHALGELQLARDAYETALAILSRVGDRRWEGNARCNLGLLYQDQGDKARAREQFERALRIAREVGHARLAHVALCNLGILLTDEGRLVEAAQHLQEAVSGAVATLDRRAEGQFRGYLALVLARQGQFGEARVMAERGEALLVASADALSHALLLCDRAEIECLASAPAVARETLARARRIADETDCGPDSELRRRLAAIDSRMAPSRD